MIARSRMICRARHGKNDWFKYDRKHSYMLFESRVQKNPVSLYDVRDAVECCSSIPDERLKSGCYHQFGVDGKMAEKYYKHIERMEREYEMEHAAKKRWFFFGRE